jgi:hypothetical protein
MIMNAFSPKASVTAEQSPVRAAEAPSQTAVQHVATSTLDDVPDGVGEKLSADDAPIHGSERE